MANTQSRIIAVLAIVIGISIPIFLTFYFAKQEALNTEKDRALSYATDILNRSEILTDQIDIAVKRLVAVGSDDPCSEVSQRLMKNIDLSSSYIQAIGSVDGDTLLCSSLGQEVALLELGPVDVVRPTGVRVRMNVEFAFAPGENFLVVERDGYAAIIHKDLPINATTDASGITLATFIFPKMQVLTSQGVIKPEWMTPRGNENTTFVDDDFIIAVASSKKYLFRTISAIPISAMNQRMYETALRMAPVGVLGSVLMAWAFFYIARRRTSMPTVLKYALKKKEFFLEYQPIIELATGKIVGAEALIRWRRMKNEIVRPDIFIPIAEECGLIQQLSQYVVKQIAVDVKEVFRQYPNFHIAINLAPDDLHDESTIDMLRELAAATGAQRGNILVEATERTFTDHELASSVIKRLRVEGFPVAIDDFGTGYSSLSYLERIELDYLKIDKSFIDTLNTDSATSGVILHIIEMAKSLKLEMIAEGVETEVQAQCLRNYGVQYAQGWLYGKPMPFRELHSRLESSDE